MGCIYKGNCDIGDCVHDSCHSLSFVRVGLQVIIMALGLDKGFLKCSGGENTPVAIIFDSE